MQRVRHHCAEAETCEVGQSEGAAGASRFLVLAHLRKTQTLASAEHSCMRNEVRSSGSAGAAGGGGGEGGDTGAKEPEAGVGADAGADAGPAAAEAGACPAADALPKRRENREGPAAGLATPPASAPVPALGRAQAMAVAVPCPPAASAANAARSSTHTLISASAMMAVSPAWSHCGSAKE